MDIKINGTTIKTPTTCIVEKYSITKAGRVLNGSMKLDLIAKKVKLLLTYSAISGDDWVIIENIVYGSAMFFTVEYGDDNGAVQTKTMYVGDISYERFRTGDGTWWWKDLKFNLIEQ